MRLLSIWNGLVRRRRWIFFAHIVRCRSNSLADSEASAFSGASGWFAEPKKHQDKFSANEILRILLPAGATAAAAAAAVAAKRVFSLHGTSVGFRGSVFVLLYLSFTFFVATPDLMLCVFIISCCAGGSGALAFVKYDRTHKPYERISYMIMPFRMSPEESAKTGSCREGNMHWNDATRRDPQHISWSERLCAGNGRARMRKPKQHPGDPQHNVGCPTDDPTEASLAAFSHRSSLLAKFISHVFELRVLVDGWIVDTRRRIWCCLGNNVIARR